jgi:hypothetical protein
MPLLLIPLLSGGVGFGLGFFTSNGLNNIAKAGLVIGGGYVAYRYYGGKA